MTNELQSKYKEAIAYLEHYLPSSLEDFDEHYKFLHDRIAELEKPKERYFFFSASFDNGFASCAIESKNYPSHSELKRIVAENVPTEATNTCVLNIVEISEQDYIDANK